MQSENAAPGTTIKSELPANLRQAYVYTDHAMLERFARQYGLALAECEALFDEVKKLIITSVLIKEGFRPSKKQDEMWHHFILHTRQYMDWCVSHFGRYVHHEPSENPTVANSRRLFIKARELFGTVDRTVWWVDSDSQTADCQGTDCKSSDCQAPDCQSTCSEPAACSEPSACSEPAACKSEIS